MKMVSIILQASTATRSNGNGKYQTTSIATQSTTSDKHQTASTAMQSRHSDKQQPASTVRQSNKNGKYQTTSIAIQYRKSDKHQHLSTAMQSRATDKQQTASKHCHAVQRQWQASDSEGCLMATGHVTVRRAGCRYADWQHWPTVPAMSLTAAAMLCKAKRQYLLTCKVSRYCLLALHGTAAAVAPSAVTSWWEYFDPGRSAGL